MPLNIHTHTLTTMLWLLLRLLHLWSESCYLFRLLLAFHSHLAKCSTYTKVKVGVCWWWWMQYIDRQSCPHNAIHRQIHGVCVCVYIYFEGYGYGVWAKNPWNARGNAIKKLCLLLLILSLTLSCSSLLLVLCYTIVFTYSKNNTRASERANEREWVCVSQ